MVTGNANPQEHRVGRALRCAPLLRTDVFRLSPTAPLPASPNEGLSCGCWRWPRLATFAAGRGLPALPASGSWEASCSFRTCSWRLSPAGRPCHSSWEVPRSFSNLPTTHEPEDRSAGLRPGAFQTAPDRRSRPSSREAAALPKTRICLYLDDVSSFIAVRDSGCPADRRAGRALNNQLFKPRYHEN
jgi:hypothetical protein